MNVKLVYFGFFDTELNGQKYKVFRFVDPQSLTIIYGTNLEGNIEEGKMYNCHIGVKRNKLVVLEII